VIDDLRSGDETIRVLSGGLVAFFGRLFQPVDIVAMALLATR
jgi:hypothetical protein